MSKLPAQASSLSLNLSGGVGEPQPRYWPRSTCPFSKEPVSRLRPIGEKSVPRGQSGIA